MMCEGSLKRRNLDDSVKQDEMLNDSSPPIVTVNLNKIERRKTFRLHLCLY